MTTPALVAGAAVTALSPTHAIVGHVALRGLPPGGPEALRLLDGTRSLRRVALESGTDQGWLCDAVEALGRHALLSVPPHGRVAVLGGGALGDDVTDLLLAEGVDVCREEPSAGWGSLAAAVLAPPAAAADRLVTDRLCRADVPHLVVGPEPRGAVVGPFVVPGRSACLSCVDQRVAEAEREHPRRLLAAQRAAAEPGPAARAWAAGLAVAHVLTHLAGGVPESVGSTWHLASGCLSMRRWVPHSRCGCVLEAASLEAADAA